MSVFKLFTTIWGLPEFQMKHGDVFDIGTYQKAAELLTSQSNLASNFFFVSNDTGKFVSSHSCRELFNGYIENYLTKDSRKPILIGFCYNGLDMEKVFAFFSTIEHKLGERARINIYPTKYKNCVVFAPSAFWFKNWYLSLTHKNT